MANCGTYAGWTPITYNNINISNNWWSYSNPFHGGWTNVIDLDPYSLYYHTLDLDIVNAFVAVGEITIESDVTTCTPYSDTWNGYSGASGTSIELTGSWNPATDNSNYFLNEGQRYGIDPQYAHGNGSYFIDHLRGNIHFSSALAGRTIILKYVSDGHGTDGEMMVPKMAEEAMYKWIAYGCAQARADVDAGTIARFKKEKGAETRKAKIRLSNIKIEEISQVMRGKSKWIKH